MSAGVGDRRALRLADRSRRWVCAGLGVILRRCRRAGHDPASEYAALQSANELLLPVQDEPKETEPRPAAVAGADDGVCDADVLSLALGNVRLSNALFFAWDASWPFVTPVPAGRRFAQDLLPGAQEIISYHIVTAGHCWAALPGGAPLALSAGDILLVSRGDEYVMASSPEGCAESYDLAPSFEFFRQMAGGELPFVVKDGGGGSVETRVICGFLGCDMRPFNPVLAALPALVRLQAGGDERLQALQRYALTEARRPRAGSGCVLVRVSELLFIEVVRRCFAELKAESGWAAALRDPVAGRALAQLHRRPAAQWTLQSLAVEIGISRSRLAERFHELVGQPPMHYLARWRLQLAADLLASGTRKVAAVAYEVGYRSESAFSRAFKRETGVSPGEWRRSARGGWA